MAWLTGWKYRKSITLSRASGAVTNYQMQLLVGESSGATGENVDCGGLCLSTFNDIRFTASDGTTLLDYWIESITGTTPNQLATVWVEFDFIGTGATTFYMYYGNSGASAVSSGDNTFIFFDHFDYSWASQTKWAGDTGSASISSSILSIVGASAVKQIASITTAGKANCAWRAYAKIRNIAASYDFLGLSTTSRDHHAILYNNADNGAETRVVQSKDGTTATRTTSNWTSNAFKIFDILVRGGTNSRYFENGTELTGSPKTGNPPNTTGLKAVFAAYRSTSVVQADWVLLRNYEYSEPAWGTWGDKEAIVEADFSETITITDVMDGLNPTIYGDTAEAITLTDAVDGYGPWSDGASETTTMTEIMEADLLKESTSETVTLTDILDGQNLTDKILETVTLTDLMERQFEVEKSTGDTITFSDLMEGILLVDGINETITFLEYGTGAPQNPHRRKQMLWNIQNKHIQLKFDHNQAGRGVHLVDCAIRCGRIRREDSVRFVHPGQHIQLKFQHNVASETISIGTVSMQVNRINNPSAAPRDIQSVRFVHQGSHMQLKFQHNEAGKTILLKSLAMACNRINNPL